MYHHRYDYTKENSIEKLINVYEVLFNEECNIALVFNRTRQRTKVYLAVGNWLERCYHNLCRIMRNRVEYF